MNRSLFGPNYAATDRDDHRRDEQHAGGLRGAHRPRPDAKLLGQPGSTPRTRITGTYSFTNIPAPGPASMAALAYQIDNCGTATGKAKAGGPIGHTRWCDGGVYYSGFTTAITPNGDPTTAEPRHGYSNGGQIVPMDWDSVDENDGGPTFMALDASSNHPGGVNALFADGSVHFVKNSVNAVHLA